MSESNILEIINDSVISFDKNGKINYVNKAFADVVGLEPTEMTGKNLWKLLPKLAQSIVYKNVNKVIEKNMPMTFEWQGPYTSRIWETKVFPSAEGVTAIGREITERQKTEEALKESENRFRSLFANMIDGFAYCRMIYNSNGEPIDFIYLEINDAFERLTGLKSEDVIDRKVSEAIPGTKEAAPEIFVTYGRVAKTGVPERFELWFKPLSLWLNISVYSPKKEHFVAIFENITGHKKAEKALRESRQAAVDYIEELKELQAKLEAKTAEVENYATKMESLAEERAKKLQDAERLAAIGATAGMVGHDIRNPLQSITGELYLLNDNLADLPASDPKGEMKESLDSITANIFYINKIVQDLQDYARPISPEFSTVDLSDVLVKIFENVKVPESIKLSIKITDLVQLKTDPMLLQRALSNLFTNAIQAMPEGGSLEISGHPVEGKVVIAVSDTGVGIPDKVKPRLFTPMMTTKAKGQGFGLAVSKRLIEAMKGTISFESEEGKGTKFIIELPAE